MRFIVAHTASASSAHTELSVTNGFVKRGRPMAGRGGSRPGAGRKKLTPESGLVEGNKDFATRVLARVGKPGWTDYTDLTKVKSDEDLALHILLGLDRKDQFNKLLDRKYGKPVQTMAHQGDKEKPLEVNVTTDSNGATQRLLDLLSRANSRRVEVSQS
jgi:hypothetical protein